MALQPSSVYQLSHKDKVLWERGDLSLKGIYAAWHDRRDRRLAEYIVKLVQLDPQPETYQAAIKAGKPTYQQLLNTLSPWKFKREIRQRCKTEGISLEVGEINRKRIRELIASAHKSHWDQIEAHPEHLPERLKVYEVLLELWNSQDLFAREILLEVIRQVPLKWGPWRGIKRIYKESIKRRDWVMFGTIAARLDWECTQSSGYRTQPNASFTVSWNARRGDVSRRTLAYLVRLGWRTLRLIASRQPALYPEVAAQVLVGYQSHHQKWALNSSWIYNHILFHDSKRYQAETFYHYPRDYYKLRAFSDLWRRSISPLLYIFERSEHEGVLTFTKESLLKDFRGELAQLDATWVQRIAQLRRMQTDQFLHTWYSELCTVAQKDYEAHGLSQPLLTLLWSADNKTSTYALTYFKAHPEALLALVTEQQVFAFIRSQRAELRELGELLLDPKMGHFTLTLEQWTTLLCDSNSHAFAARHIPTLFSSKDLSLEWFASCINSDLDKASDFAIKLLQDPTYQPEGGDLFNFYWTLLTPEKWRSKSAKAAFEGLESVIKEDSTLEESDRSEPDSDQADSDQADSDQADSDQADSAQKVVKKKKKKEKEERRFLNQLSTAQLCTLFIHPESEGRTRLQAWVKKRWLDPRLFKVDWLKRLLDVYAWQEQWWLESLEDEGKEWRKRREHQADFKKIAQAWLLTPSFFTLSDLGEKWVLDRAFMNNWEMRPFKQYVQKYVPFSAFAYLDDPNAAKDQQGEDAGEVKKKKREKSLKKLEREIKGLNRLIDHLFNEPSWNTQSFITSLLKDRHPRYQKSINPNSKGPASKIALKDELLGFHLFKRLSLSIEDSNRALALHFAEYEMSRWTKDEPLTFKKLLPFFISGAEDVQTSLLKAMSPSPRSADARIDVRLPQFKANDLYAFCFSPRSKVRDLGLSMIGDYPDRFADPTRLATLAESSDRRVCEGVVKLLWTRLRHAEISRPWRPYPQSVAPQSAVAKRQAELIAEHPPTGKRPNQIRGKRYIGAGIGPTESVNASEMSWLIDFLRRTIFRLSPSHPYKEDLNRLTKSTSAWRNKVQLIKAMRDLATQDQGFAELITPILKEFMASRGQSERAACLVAITRIRAAHPELAC